MRKTATSPAVRYVYVAVDPAGEVRLEYIGATRASVRAQIKAVAHERVDSAGLRIRRVKLTVYGT